MKTRVSSAKTEVIIGDGRPTVLIGERINPTGKKKLSAALQSGDFDIIREEAVAQVQAGADILDVNVGVVGLDERMLLPQAVKAVMEVADVPLCLDSGNSQALEAALRVFPGKPLVNSVTGEKRSLDRVLPLIKEYGAAVIGLTMDDDGIPSDADRRVKIAERIVTAAERLGIPREDVIIDCLAQTLGIDTRSGAVTIQAIRKVKHELCVNITLGCSNLSFGLPDRELLTCAFLAVGIAAGVNCPIVDVAKVRSIVLASDLIMGCDDFAKRYTGAYRQRHRP